MGTPYLAAIENRRVEPAPFGRYGVPHYSMINVSDHLVDLGSLCLLDFANHLPKDEGPPLYLIYSRKVSVSNQNIITPGGNCWIIVHDYNCDLVTVSDVVIEHPTEMQPKTKKNKTKINDLCQNESFGPRNVEAETRYRPRGAFFPQSLHR